MHARTQKKEEMANEGIKERIRIKQQQQHPAASQLSI